MRSTISSVGGLPTSTLKSATGASAASAGRGRYPRGGDAIQLHYFDDTDTLYIDLRDEPATETEDLTEDVLVDYNAQRQIVGLTIEGASRYVDLAPLETENLPPGLLAYIRRRLEEVDIASSDLDGLDMSSSAFRIAMRHGMATAFHEMEHRLMDMETPSPHRQGTLP